MAVQSDCDRGRGAARSPRPRALTPVLLATAAFLVLIGAEPSAASAATSLHPAAGAKVAPAHDPWEWLNRRFYALNRVIDRVILRPASIVYETLVPRPLRRGVHNFVGNLDEPLVFTNDLLQFRLSRAGRTLTRFAANSSFGVGGLFDVATSAGIAHHDNDFGVTLARYGAPAGPYVFLPLLGPTTVRDLAGSSIDFFADPLTFAHYHALAAFDTTTFVVGGLDQRSNAESDLQEIDQMGTDSYATMRSLYLQNRQAEIEDGSAVDIQNLPDFDDPGATAQAQAAPAPTPSLADSAPAAASQVAGDPTSAPDPDPRASAFAAPAQPATADLTAVRP